MMSEETKGYIVVASREKRYYSFATHLIGTIKDHYPEANCTLVTEERFLDGRESEADNVIICDNHYRAKLWGMANSPYDITMYIDADMYCCSESIKDVFDELGDHDLMFTGLAQDRWYVFRDTEFPGGTFTLCGAVCLYRSSNPLVREFMKDWDEYYKLQYTKKWWPLNDQGEFDYLNYPEQLSIWDQFTLWWLTNKEEKYKDLKVGIFENDLRWNYWMILDREKNPMPEDTVLMHVSAQADKNTGVGTYVDFL
jgi:hypothetical protein